MLFELLRSAHGIVYACWNITTLGLYMRVGMYLRCVLSTEYENAFSFSTVSYAVSSLFLEHWTDLKVNLCWPWSYFGC